MTYAAKASVCSELFISLSADSEHNVEFFNIKPCGTERNRWALKYERSERKRIWSEVIYDNNIRTDNIRWNSEFKI